MKVLVTGGTGFVGSALVRRLHDGGHVAVILSRPGGKRPTSAASFEWDPKAGPPPAEAWEGIEGVVNLAGEPMNERWTESKKRRIKGSRVDTTDRLVEGMSRTSSPPRVLVSTSAIGYYGDRADETLTEEATAGSDFLANVCREWEVAAMGAEKLGTRVARTRFGIVVGREAPAMKRLELLGKVGLLGPIAGGKQWWSWVHIDDVIGFLVHALEIQASGPFNVVAPDARRQKDWAATLGRVMHRPSLVPAPAFAVRAVIGGFATEVLSSRHVIPAATQASGYEFAYPDLEPALKHLVG